MKKRLYVGVGIFALAALTAAGVWYAKTKYKELETNLDQAHQQSAQLEQKLTERERAVREERARAEAALQRAATARASADQETEARVEAETQRDEALTERDQAHVDRQAAEAQAAHAQQQIADLRGRRERELDRMREALNQIAPTRRTASGMVIELANDSFYFDFDKANLRPQNREIQSRIAGVLLASEGYRLFIDGHTDDTGSKEYNQQLSKRRAQSVADYLVNAGVPKDLLHVEGLGQSNPRAKNDTQAGRQKNRRVEIGIVDSIIQYQKVAESER